MNITHFYKTPLTAALALALHSPLLLSAPGTLPVSPLFTGASIEPNVYFVVDDSGSMEWEVLVSGAPSGVLTACRASESSRAVEFRGRLAGRLCAARLPALSVPALRPRLWLCAQPPRDLADDRPRGDSFTAC